MTGTVIPLVTVGARNLAEGTELEKKNPVVKSGIAIWALMMPMVGNSTADERD